jgi:hypothetical protein
VSFTGITFGGADAANYSVLPTINATATANITPAPVTISGLSANNKVYDKSLAATLSGSSFTIASGLLGTDTAIVFGSATGGGTFVQANVGNGITVIPTFTGLSLSNNNYYINGVASALTANITPAPLTINGLSANNKVYDSTANATLNGTSLTANGVFSGDSVTLTGTVTAASFAQAAVGTGISVNPTLSGLNLSNSNYYINGVTTPLTANITPAPLAISVAGKFNGTTVFTNSNSTISIAGLKGSDTITITGVTVNNSHVSGNGSNYVTAITSSSGLSIANYSMNTTYLAANSPLAAGTTSALSPNAVLLTAATITAFVTPDSGIVAGVNNFIPNTTTLIGVIPGTSVTGTTVLTIASNRPGFQTITNNGTTLSGPNAGDYEVISSNLASNGTNNVTPNSVSTGNGGGTIILAAPASTINSGTVANVANDVPVQVPVVIPVVVNSVSVNTSSPSLSLNSISFVSYGSPEVGNVVFKVTQANGDPLPDWVKVDPVTHTLTVEDVPEAKETKLSINVQKLVNGKLKKEALLTLQQ